MNKEDYNFVCGSLLVRNLASNTKGGTYTEDVENRVLRRIFGPKRDEVTGDSRKLHNEQLHNLYSSPNIIDQVKEDGMGRACSTNGGDEECI
jgi:hypothetical protein